MCREVQSSPYARGVAFPPSPWGLMALTKPPACPIRKRRWMWTLEFIGLPFDKNSHWGNVKILIPIYRRCIWQLDSCHGNHL